MKTTLKITFLTITLFTLLSCKDKAILTPQSNTSNSTVPLSIGQNYQGGTIFYIDESGQHGLIAAPTDEYFTIPANSTEEFYFQVSGISGNVGSQLTKINFSITHQDVYSLRVKLKAPNGTIIQLAYTNINQHGANFSNTTIQTGYPTMLNAYPPFTGTYAPDEAFSLLSSSTANGQWSIIIVNESSTYSAQISNTTVTFNSSINFPLTTKTWNSNGSNLLTTATGTVIGTGASNTTSILNYQGSGSYAAKECADLNIGGYQDWYLPSINELTEMYNNRSLISGINTSGIYWSSSQTSSTNAYRKSFSSGTNSNSTKSSLSYYRAIRSF